MLVKIYSKILYIYEFRNLKGKTMRNRYAYIGHFEITSGVIDIADPYINSMTVALERIPYANEKMIKVRRALSGMYEAYHVIDMRTDEIYGLLVLHCSYDIAEISKEKHICGLGYASSGLSNAIVVVDERFRFDTTYCYNPIELEAYYDGNLILKEVSKMPYEECIKNELKEWINNIMGQEDLIHPTGTDIMKIIGDRPIWNGFMEFKLNSSQWSVDVINRLRNCYTNGIGIKGGIVSTSPGGYLSCHSFNNHRGDTYALYISFQQSADDKNNTGTKSMPTFEELL